MPLKISFTYKNLIPKAKMQAEQYVLDKVEKVEKRLPAGEAFLRVRVEKFAKKAAYKVELELQAPRQSFVASEDDHTISEAVDFALDKLVKQVKRAGGRMRPSHHKFPRARAVSEGQAAWARLLSPEQLHHDDREEFFNVAGAVLKPLMRTLQHEIRVRGLEGEEEVAPEAIADEAIVAAWEGRRRKPQAMSTKQWLYQAALTLFEGHATRMMRAQQADSLEEVVPEESEASRVSNLGDEVKDFWQPDELTVLADTISDAKRRGGLAPSQRARYHHVLATLAEFTPQARQAFLLKYKEGFEADEIAMIQRRARQAVEQDLKETLAVLKIQLT